MDDAEHAHAVQRFQLVEDIQRNNVLEQRRNQYRRELLNQQKMLLKGFTPIPSLKIVAKKVENPFQENDTCSICLQVNKDVPCRRLECKHVFHEPCIRRWLNMSVQNNSHTCPLCRQNVHIKVKKK